MLLNLLILSDVRFVREGLSDLLGRDAALRIVCCCNTGTGVLARHDRVFSGAPARHSLSTRHHCLASLAQVRGYSERHCIRARGDGSKSDPAGIAAYMPAQHAAV